MSKIISKKIILFKSNLFFFLFICQLSHTQYSSLEIKSINNLNEKATDSILENIDLSYQKSKIAHNFSRFFYNKRNFRLALKYGKAELDILNILKIKNKDYHNAIHLLGRYYYLNNDKNKALETFTKSSKLNIYPKKAAQSLCELGNVLRSTGKYSESISYLSKGIELLKIHGKKTSIITHCINLSFSSNFSNIKDEIKLGIKYLNFAKQIIFTDKIQKHKLNLIYTGLANHYSKKQIYDFSKARKYYGKVIDNARKTSNLFFLSVTYSNLGELFLSKKSDSSIYFLQKSSNIINENHIPNNKLIETEISRNKANYYLNKNDLNLALTSIKKSLSTSFNQDNINSTPSIIDIIETVNRYNISKALKTKIQILNKLYLKSKNSKYLNQIIETVKISDQLIEIILEDSTESSTQFSWRNDVSKIYNYGIYAARILGNDDLQFQYLEKNKAFLLTQSINDNNYSLNLPNHIVNKEIEYKKQILNLESKVSESKQLKDSLFDIKFNYQNFKDSIQLAYPKHFESKQKVQLTSLDKVQNSINDNTIIISYALQDEEIIDNASSGLLISKNKTIPFAISNIDTLQKNLNLFRKLIAKPLNTKKEINQFNRVSHFLYQNLFPTKEIQELIKGKQLTIIADNQLQNIPFEAFITDTSSNSYLIEDNDISYAYSMSFSDINNKIERTQTKEFAGFAPINFENQKLTSLEYSEKEINTISNNLNGLSLTGNSVTKDSFFKNASNAKIIHLATHADISKKPVIHFSKDSLNLHELYTYKNNADLVVLSACETNLGELKKGEGILNLARGFFYSGSKSVVSSLWKVNDVATTSLMSDFYANLKNHQSKSEAINNAKRNYLKTHTLSEKSPYYWASFILIGDTTPTFESDYTIYWIIGSLLFGVLLFFLGVKTLKKKEK
ncbi:CHAT domain-containing tetratricopeptide repeat protein [uncultured Tenacibaculum sp.]|uniref:CHAT domain-containing protein n=1 Tax=uncultured Tenacibaculum sp. TaxID=174713 RepID=UPI002604EF0F|nr:CHAT domain-containing tetratricopeptide repeat protein [uncultured Tenacibaculum sp.]